MSDGFVKNRHTREGGVSGPKLRPKRSLLLYFFLQFVHQLLIPLPFAEETDLPAGFRHVGKIYIEALVGELVLGALGPFYHRRAVGINILVEPYAFQFRGVFQPVEVDVVERHPAVILIDEGESRARNVLFPHLETERDAVGEMGLARAQIAVETDQVALPEQRAQGLSDAFGLLRAGGDDAEHHSAWRAMAFTTSRLPTMPETAPPFTTGSRYTFFSDMIVAMSTTVVSSVIVMYLVLVPTESKSERLRQEQLELSQHIRK